MSYNKAIIKAALIIAFLCDFGYTTGQTVTTLTGWEGDITSFDIDGNTLRCTTDDEVTIHARQDAARGQTWTMQLSVPDGEMASVGIFPMSDDAGNLDGDECFRLTRNNENRYVSVLNISGGSDAYNVTALTADNAWMTLALQLTAEGEWIVTVNGEEIFEDTALKSHSFTAQIFALRFEGMNGASVRNVQTATDETPEEPDNPDDGGEDPDNGSGDGEDSGDDGGDTDEQHGDSLMTYGDVVFTEIMANPSNVAGLPEAEYVEICNATDSVIDISGWTLRYGSKDYEISRGEINPSSYIILTKAGREDEWESAKVTARIDMDRFPTLANTGNTLYLFDAGGTTVAYTNYTDKRYGDAFKAEGGFSIERISIGNINDTPRNWAASCDLSGGTPGRANSVSGRCDDRQLASFAYAEMLSPDTFNLHFTMPLDNWSTANDNWCEVTDGSNQVMSTVADPSHPECAIIVLESPLQWEETAVISIDGLLQIDGEVAIAPDKVMLTIPRKAVAGDLVFNEILFDTNEGQSEFVELTNTTPHCIEAYGLALVTINQDGSTSRSCRLSEGSRLIQPMSFLAATTDTAALGKIWMCKPWNSLECSLPSLNNEGGRLALMDESAVTLDMVIYSPDCYPSTARPSRGISLEKLSPSLASNSPDNWLPATAECGYATPGRINSQAIDAGNTAPEGTFSLQSDYITPDGDGDNDTAIISYRMNEGGWTADITIYDSDGREVARPVQRETLASEGHLFWHGTDDAGNVLRKGIYVMLLEAFNQGGETIVKKIAIAVN